MYFLLGIAITLALLLIANMLIALLASAGWKVLACVVSRMPAAARTEIIFALRILPVAASLIFVLAYVIPAYLLLEPAASGEVVSTKLALIAMISSVGVGIALYRVINTWVVTRRLVSNWLSGAERIELGDGTVPVFRIDHPFPVIAVTGIFRRRLFVAKAVFASLDDNEMAAALAHEYGHLKAKDNFKRTLLRVCRDLVLLPVGKGLDRDWAETAESAADEFAARAGGSTALDLASALIKITRIVPSNGTPAMPLASFVTDGQNADVAARVSALIRLSESRNSFGQTVFFGISPAMVLWLAGLLFILILPFIDNGLYLSTHEGIEQFVRILQ